MVTREQVWEMFNLANLDRSVKNAFRAFFAQHEDAVYRAFQDLQQDATTTAVDIKQVVESLLGGLPDNIADKLAEILETSKAAAAAAQKTDKMVGHLLVHRVQAYMAPSSTNTTTTQQDTFRSKVTEHYGYSDERETPQLCMLTNCSHDWHDLVAGHIVARSRESDARVDLNMKDINNPRNGIFWSRAAEGAWSAGIFCFSSPGPGVFQFKLLDDVYAEQRIQDWPLSRKPLKSSTKTALGDMTWGQLHGTGQLHFLPGCSGRPYSRALCFMAHMALLNSKMRGWNRPEGVDSDAEEFQYMSDDGNIESTAAWVEAVSSALKETT